MKDWRGFEGLFHRGELPVEELLELTERHFSFRPTPAPEMSFFRPLEFTEEVDRQWGRMMVDVATGKIPPEVSSGKLIHDFEKKMNRHFYGTRV